MRVPQAKHVADVRQGRRALGDLEDRIAVAAVVLGRGPRRDAKGIRGERSVARNCHERYDGVAGLAPEDGLDRRNLDRIGVGPKKVAGGKDEEADGLGRALVRRALEEPAAKRTCKRLVGGVGGLGEGDAPLPTLAVDEGGHSDR